MNPALRQFIVPNPEYEQAPFELAHFALDGSEVPNALPLRFRIGDSTQAMQLMSERKWKELRKLSVPPHLVCVKEIEITGAQIADVLKEIGE